MHTSPPGSPPSIRSTQQALNPGSDQILEKLDSKGAKAARHLMRCKDSWLRLQTVNHAKTGPINKAPEPVKKHILELALPSVTTHLVKANEYIETMSNAKKEIQRIEDLRNG